MTNNKKTWCECQACTRNRINAYNVLGALTIASGKVGVLSIICMMYAIINGDINDEFKVDPELLKDFKEMVQSELDRMKHIVSNVNYEKEAMNDPPTDKHFDFKDLMNRK